MTFKKIILLGAATFSLCLTGCGEAEPTSSGTPTTTSTSKDPVEEYTVTFDSMGGSAVSPITVKKGEKITKPTDPTRKYYTFLNWYTEESLTHVYDFNSPVLYDFTLYAGWEDAPRNMSLKTAVFADIQLCAKENSNPYGSYYANAGNTVHAYVALKNHFKLCKQQNVDVILMNGDIVNNAVNEYYDLFETALRDVYGNNELEYPTIIYNMGNHEWWNLLEQETAEAVTMFKAHARIGDVARQTSVKYYLKPAETLPTYYRVVKGIPFLVISGENSAGQIGDTMKSEIQSWLTEMSQLESVREGGPIYVLYHCALHTTLTHGNGAFEQARVLEDLLKNYPQAVVFTGDTHYSGVNERAINQVDFTAINIGSSSYSRMDKMSATMSGDEHFYNMAIKGGKTSDELLGDAAFKHEYTPTIHIMKTFDNLDTTIDRYFSTDDETSPIHINKTWDIPRGTNKSNFKYTNARFENVVSANDLYGANGVSWSNTAQVKFGVKNGKMTVIVPETNEYHYTEHYKIDVTGNTTKTYDVVGSYYKYNSERENTYFFLEDLPAGDSYSVKVTAYDHFDNPSLNFLTSSTNDLTACADEKDNAYTNTYYELSNHLRYDDHAEGSNTSIEYFYEGVKQNQFGAPLGQLIRDTVPGKTTGGNSISEYLSIGSTENCEIILKAKVKNLGDSPLKFGYQLYASDFTYKNAEIVTMTNALHITEVPANSNWMSLEWNVTELFPDVYGRSRVTFLALIVSADGYGYNSEGYQMHFLLDDMDVAAGEEIGEMEVASRYNLEMCQYSDGQWRGEGSAAKVSYSELRGLSSTSSRKITFKNSNGLPASKNPLSQTKVYASFDLAQTASIGTNNDIDIKSCTLSFDVKFSQEFFESENNYRNKFYLKHEDSSWASRTDELNIVANASDFTYENSDEGWFHVECNLEGNTKFSGANAKTYAITLGFFGISNETRTTAYIVLDNIALTANS